MTTDEIEQGIARRDANRQLDAAIAEKIMGYTDVHSTGGGSWWGKPPEPCEYGTKIPHYTTYTDDALEVAAKLEIGVLPIRVIPSDDDHDTYTIQWVATNSGYHGLEISPSSDWNFIETSLDSEYVAPTAALAICKLALDMATEATD